MAGYSKDFLIDCYLHRLKVLGTAKEQVLRDIAIKQYDQQGKTVWRSYASVTPEAIREFQKFIDL